MYMKKYKLCIAALVFVSFTSILASCQSGNKGKSETSAGNDTTAHSGLADSKVMDEENEDVADYDSIEIDDNEDFLSALGDNSDVSFGTNGTMLLYKTGTEGSSMSPNTYFARYGNYDETFLCFNCYPHSKFGKKDFAELTACRNDYKSIANVSVMVPSYVDLEDKQYRVERVTMINHSVNGYPTAGRIVIPSSVEKIKIWGWLDLHEVVLNEGVEELNERAFRGCPDLESVVLPNTLKKIGKLAFENCGGLKKIHIPASVIDVCDGAAFVGLNKGIIIEVEKGCKALNDLKPEKVEIVGSHGYEHYTFNPEDINIVFLE